MTMGLIPLLYSHPMNTKESKHFNGYNNFLNSVNLDNSLITQDSDNGQRGTNN